MALADNRTQLQDCEDNAHVSGDSDASPNSDTTESGLVIENTTALQFQVNNSGQEHVLYDLDAAGATFSIDTSDMTLYIMIKDNLLNTFAGLGGQLCLNDGADGAGGDDIGYNICGADVGGLAYEKRYHAYKLDVSVVAAAPGTVNVDFTAYNGTEAGLNHAAILQVGYGGNHLAKAQGTIPNAWFDGIYYIANDSYAATISGGTAATPETMTDVVGDDVTLGAGMFNNPKGTEFGFFAPTEWGHATAETAFSADGEQWYFYGDNGGGHAVGVTHFPQRVFGGSGTNSWVLNGCVLVNIGTPAEFDLSDTTVETLTVDGGSWDGFGTISLPSSGGTSRFTTNVVFINCAQVTNNGADMDGCSVLASTVAADVGALLYNEAADPDGTLDNLTIESGAAAHHAIDFGTNVDSSLVSITLRGIAFNSFGAVDDANASTVRFLATTGSLTLNLIDCTVDGVSPVASGGGKNFSVDDAAGMTVTVVVAPVTLQITVTDKADDLPIQNVQTSIHLKDSPFTELMNEDTTASGIASESYAGSTPVDIVWKTRKSDDLDSPRYFAQSGLGEITTAGFTLAVLLEENTILP